MFLWHFPGKAWNFHKGGRETGQGWASISTANRAWTAAVLGGTSREELAAAFRPINPATSFDLGKTDIWVANCPLAEFAAALA